MTVAELIEILKVQDQKKRVVCADTDGAGTADDIEMVDQRVEKGEPIITIWYHR